MSCGWMLSTKLGHVDQPTTEALGTGGSSPVICKSQLALVFMVALERSGSNPMKRPDRSPWSSVRDPAAEHRYTFGARGDVAAGNGDARELLPGARSTGGCPPERAASPYGWVRGGNRVPAALARPQSVLAMTGCCRLTGRSGPWSKCPGRGCGPSDCPPPRRRARRPRRNTPGQYGAARSG